jgi:hypothetical protein
VKQGELFGSWLDELHFRDLRTNETELMFKIPPLVQNAYMQYMFNHHTLQINYCDESMKGTIAPTDSRFRGDIKCYEDGQIEQSEVEKVAIETRQRNIRKWIAEGKMEAWKPKFFREVPHPYIKSNEQLNSKEEKIIMYEMI